MGPDGCMFVPVSSPSGVPFATRCLAALVLAFIGFGCSRPQPSGVSAAPSSTNGGPSGGVSPDAAAFSSPRSSEPARSANQNPAEPLPRVPAPLRLVAIGDLHGDLEAARAALKLGGAIDDKDHWVGGHLVVVQTGDELDRADEDRAIVELFDRLKGQASSAGGAVIPLNGNHEVMNVQLNFDYVTPGAFRDFESVGGLDRADSRLALLPDEAKARGAALMPGGVFAKRLAARDVMVMVGESVFVHGGVLPKHISYGLARINREVRAWMNGDTPAPPDVVVKEDAPVWTRRYSASADSEDCRVLTEVLSTLGAKRMVVGHTVQRHGINAACDEKVWRIDVGMSRYYHGGIEVLEIAGDAVRALKAAHP